MQSQLPLFAIIAIAALGLGFALGWTAAPTDRAGGADVERDLSDDTTAQEPPIQLPEGNFGLDSPHAREARLTSELAEARNDLSALQAEHEALKARVPDETDPEGGEGGAADPKSKPTFTYPATEAALAEVDWQATGTALSKMPPLIGEMLQSIYDGAPKIELQGRIQSLNGPLLTEAIKLMGKDALSGTGVNGVFTHPAVQVNFVASALVEAGLPLDERQTERLEDIGDRFLAEEQARVAGHTEQMFGLEKMIGEAAQRDRFFAEVDALLTPEQVEALHPAVSRGRLRADLFSSGLLWLTVTGKIGHKDRAELARSLAATAMLKLGLPPEAGDTVRQLAETFAGGFSDAYLAHEPDALDRQQILHVGRVTVAAQQMLQFLQGVHEQVPMDVDKSNGLRDTILVLVPLKSPGA